MKVARRAATRSASLRDDILSTDTGEVHNLSDRRLHSGTRHLHANRSVQSCLLVCFVDML